MSFIVRPFALDRLALSRLPLRALQASISHEGGALGREARTPLETYFCFFACFSRPCPLAVPAFAASLPGTLPSGTRPPLANAGAPPMAPSAAFAAAGGIAEAGGPDGGEAIGPGPMPAIGAAGACCPPLAGGTTTLITVLALLTRPPLA